MFQRQTPKTNKKRQQVNPYTELHGGARKEGQEMKKNQLKTPEEIREEIARQGISIAEWAERHGLKPRPVYDVLSKRNKGCFGEAHRAAVLLGLKDGTIEERVSA